MIEPFSAELTLIVVIGFGVAFVLAFGIGANDVANSFGTSVGSKVLTMQQACLLASIFEILGAILIGGNVSHTIREGMIDPILFDGQEKEYAIGLVASLGGCCLWMLMATFLKLPVSGTHSIVGSTMGFALVAKGVGAIKWFHLLKIVSSWFISPLLCGFISVTTYLLIRKLILNKSNPFESGLQYLPFFYSLTILINVLSVLLSGPSFLYFHNVNVFAKLGIVALVGLIVALFVRFFTVPRMRKRIGEKEEKRIGKRIEMEACQSLRDRLGCADGDDDQSCARIRSFQRSLVEESDHQKNYFPNKDFACQVDHLMLLLDHNNKDEDVDKQHKYKNATSRCSALNRHVQLVLPLAKQRIAARNLVNSETHSEPNFPNLSRNIVKTSEDFAQKVTVASSERHYKTTTAVAANDVVMKLRRIGHRPYHQQQNQHHQKNCDVIGEDREIEELVDAVVAKSKTKSKRKDDAKDDSEDVRHLFSFLQVLTAIFGSFAHGGNDVSNAIGPLISLWILYMDGNVRNYHTPLWVLFFGGVGIIVGLWTWGRRVIKTIGEDLTKITPSVGFVIEISTAFTVLFASNLSIPVSTTHCKVGSVVFTGRVRSKQSVDWSLFGNIIIAWLVTVPVTGIISAALMAVFRQNLSNTHLNRTLLL